MGERVVVAVGATTIASPVAAMTGPFTDTNEGTAVTVTPHSFGASVVRDDGEPTATRTAFWFAVASASSDVEVRTP